MHEPLSELFNVWTKIPSNFSHIYDYVLGLFNVLTKIPSIFIHIYGYAIEQKNHYSSLFFTIMPFHHFLRLCHRQINIYLQKYQILQAHNVCVGTLVIIKCNIPRVKLCNTASKHS